ncbi:MAG: MFS transporter [Acidisphaera sp.]|nr:MFS transporter [Acidisphaera sp.]
MTRLPDDAAEPPATARWAVGIAGFCALLNMYAPQAILPTLAASFHASPVGVGLTITATTLATALCAPFAGAIADRVGRKRAIVVGLSALAVPTALSGFSASLNELILTRFLQGLLMPAAFAASIGYIGEEWDRARVGRVTSFYISATVGGGFAGRFAGGLAADFADWHWTFFLLAAMNLAGAALVWRLLPEPRRFVRGGGLGQAIGAIIGHLRNRRLLSAYCVGFNVLFGLVTLFTYVNFHLAAPPYRLNAAELGLVFCVYLVGIGVTPVAGRWIDRIGQRRTLLLSTLTAAIGGALTLLAPLAAIIAGLAVFCCGTFVSQSVATSYVGIAAGSSRSSAAGLYLTFFYAGGAIGAWLPGYAWEHAGWAACVGLAMAVQGVVAAIALLLWRD